MMTSINDLVEQKNKADDKYGVCKKCDQSLKDITEVIDLLGKVESLCKKMGNQFTYVLTWKNY